jgi:hypothetical protein
MMIRLGDQMLTPSTHSKNSLTFVNQRSRDDNGFKIPASAQMSLSGELPASAPARTRIGVRLVTHAAIAWLGAMAAGCGEHRLTDAELSFATRSITVDPSRAIVTLPPGGPPIVSVTQRSYDNAVSQTISLSTRGRTPGENAIYVAFLTAADLPETAGVEGRLLPEPSVEDFAIAREMEERLPGLAMVPSAAYVQNSFGPFGYAFARSSAGEGCIYVWQRIASGDSIFRPKSGVISVRIRVCQSGASEAALLRLAYGYSINASLRRSGWDPIGDTPPPPVALGEAGAPIYPVPQASFPLASERPLPSARPRLPRPARSQPVRVDSVEPVPNTPLEGYPTIPPPPVSRP